MQKPGWRRAARSRTSSPGFGLLVTQRDLVHVAVRGDDALLDLLRAIDLRLGRLDLRLGGVDLLAGLLEILVGLVDLRLRLLERVVDLIVRVVSLGLDD